MSGVSVDTADDSQGPRPSGALTGESTQWLVWAEHTGNGRSIRQTDVFHAAGGLIIKSAGNVFAVAAEGRSGNARLVDEESCRPRLDVRESHRQVTDEGIPNVQGDVQIGDPPVVGNRDRIARAVRIRV